MLHDGQDSLLLDLPRSTSTAQECSNGTGPMSRTMAMCDHSTADGFGILISLQRAFLASLSRAQGRGVELATIGSYGPSLRDCLARFDPGSLSWKTFQPCFPSMAGESSGEYSVIWPRSGLMLRGTAFPLPPLARCIDETECGLLPTPRATDANHGGPNQRDSKGHPGLSGAVSKWPTPQNRDYRSGQESRWLNPERTRNLNDAVARWPTPTARDHKDTGDLTNVPTNGLLGRAVSPSKASGALSPTWVEWLQGFPKEWTVLKDSETQSCRR